MSEDAIEGELLEPDEPAIIHGLDGWKTANASVRITGIDNTEPKETVT